MSKDRKEGRVVKKHRKIVEDMAKIEPIEIKKPEPPARWITNKTEVKKQSK